jgi:hypothetical protein
MRPPSGVVRICSPNLRFTNVFHECHNSVLWKSLAMHLLFVDVAGKGISEPACSLALVSSCARLALAALRRCVQQLWGVCSELRQSQRPFTMW